MLRKVISVGLICLFLIGGVVGCAGKPAPPPQPTQPSQEVITPPELPQKSAITVRAVDQNNTPRTAAIEIKKTSGAVVIIATTPLDLTLEWGTYTFIFKYQDLIIEKTIEIKQPTQEIVAQFEIPQQPVVLEITSDELLLKIHTVIIGRREGKNVAELENWLLSLVNQTIRVRGEIAAIYEYGETITTGFYKLIGYNPYEIICHGDISLKEILKVGQEFTIEGKVDKIEFGGNRVVWMKIDKVVKAH